MNSVKPGLKLALTFIDSKLYSVSLESNRLKILEYAKGPSRTKSKAALRLEGAEKSLTQLRERIIRALGPDAE